MIEKIYKKLYLISNSLYNSIGNQDLYERIRQIEDEEYSKLSYDELNKLYNSLEIMCCDQYLNFIQPHELAYYNIKDHLILRRMQEKSFIVLNQYVEYDNENSRKDIVKINDNISLKINNYEQALSEVYLQALNVLTAKYLYFLDKNTELKEELKNQIKHNICFMLPNVEENQELDVIKNESYFYNNLWNDMKKEYDSFLEEYLSVNVHGMMEIMLFDDLNNLELNALNEIYLRTLFNYLDREELEKLNYEFNEMDLSKANILGETNIRKAFRSIDGDVEAIKKIKNSR